MCLSKMNQPKNKQKKPKTNKQTKVMGKVYQTIYTDLFPTISVQISACTQNLISSSNGFM